MSDNRYKFLNLNDAIFFDKIFDERKKDSLIVFSDFCDLALNNIAFSKSSINDVLENLKKLKDRQGSLHENDIFLSIKR